MLGKLVLIRVRCWCSSVGLICVLMWNISFCCLLVVFIVLGVNCVVLVMNEICVGIMYCGVVFSMMCVLLFSVSLLVMVLGMKKVMKILFKFIRLSSLLFLFSILFGCVMWYCMCLVCGVISVLLLMLILMCWIVVMVVVIVVCVLLIWVWVVVMVVWVVVICVLVVVMVVFMFSMWVWLLFIFCSEEVFFLISIFECVRWCCVVFSLLVCCVVWVSVVWWLFLCMVIWVLVLVMVEIDCCWCVWVLLCWVFSDSICMWVSGWLVVMKLFLLMRMVLIWLFSLVVIFILVVLMWLLLLVNFLLGLLWCRCS